MLKMHVCRSNAGADHSLEQNVYSVIRRCLDVHVVNVKKQKLKRFLLSIVKCVRVEQNKKKIF